MSDILDHNNKPNKFITFLEYMISKIIEIYVLVVVWGVTILLLLISIFGGSVSFEIRFSSIYRIIDYFKDLF